MSQFTDAITQSMISGLDPMNGVIRQFATQQVSTADIQLDDLRLEMMSKIENRLATAVENKAPASVIHAYEKMLAKYYTQIG